MQAAALSKAPIIASHSATRALCDISRNMDDEQTCSLKKSGGVIQVVAYSGFVKRRKPDSPELKQRSRRQAKNTISRTPTGPGQRARSKLP